MKSRISLVPKLRFRGFSGEWHIKPLRDISKKVSERNKSINSDTVLTNSATRGVILQTDFFDKEIAVQGNLENYFKVAKDDFVYNPRISTSAPVGPFKRNHYGKGAMSPLYTIFRFNSDENLSFFEQYLSTKKWHKYMKSVANYGARHDRMSISIQDLEDLPLPYPESKEQEKIAGFLGVVDDKISGLEKKKEQLEKYKKGIMQKIFTQRIRFKKESGEIYPDWQQKELGEILEYEQPTKYIVESTEYDGKNKIPVLTAGKTFILGYTNETQGVFDKNLPVIIFDDFTTASQFVNFPFKVKSSAMKILKAKPGVNIKIAYELLKRIKYVANDHKRYWIGEFQDFPVSLPSKEEQEKIADFLTPIDDKIELQNKKLQQAKQFKESLLQKMFV